MNITEDYCSYEVAKLLKEKGFDEPCLQMWECGPDKKYLFRLQSSCYQNITEEDSCLAPTHQMACKWLREVHSIVITIDLRKVNQGKGWGYIAVIHTLEKDFDTELLYADYAHCIDEALKYSLENLI